MFKYVRKLNCVQDTRKSDPILISFPNQKLLQEQGATIRKNSFSHSVNENKLDRKWNIPTKIMEDLIMEIHFFI